MQEPSKAASTKYFVLAIVFLVAVSFQCSMWVQDISDLLRLRDPLAALLTTDWLLILVLRWIAPLYALGLGFYVASVRVEDRRAWLMLAVLISFSINTDGADVHDRVMQWSTPLKHVALLYRTAVLRSWPLWLLVFAIYFPERARFDRKHSSWKWIVLVPLLAVYALSVGERVAMNESGSFGDLHASLNLWAHRGFLLLYWLGVPLFLLMLFGKLHSESDPDGKRRLRVLLYGFSISLLPPTAFDAFLHHGKGLRTAQVHPLVVVPIYCALALFPVTLAYVTVVQRALDLRVIVRQSLQYAFAKRGLVLVQIFVSVIVVFCIAWLTGTTSLGSRILITALGIALILSVGLVGRKLAQWIDRQFFREAYRTEQILTALAGSVGSIMEIQPLFETVASKIAEAMHIAKVAIFIRKENQFTPAMALGYDGEMLPGFAEGTHLVASLRNVPDAVTLYDERWRTRASGRVDTDTLREIGSELLVPVCRRDSLLAFMSLGSKTSEEPYSSTDIELLHIVANQTALAIENSQLTETVASETAQREMITRELAIARDVQQRLFPQVQPSMPGVEYAAMCRPAREIGGDYYDYFSLTQETLGIAIGDVSGKGIPAALLMASLQAALRGQAVSGGVSISHVISNVNSVIYATSPANRYATFFYAQYEACSGRLAYINAGHNAPIVIRRTAGNLQTIRLDTGGPPVGLFPSSEYQTGTLQTAGGDLLLLFTDGISEAMNSADEEWGEEQLIEMLQGSGQECSDQILRRILEAADAFVDGAPQHDDMTLMVFRFQENRRQTGSSV